jgi:hypothetical protein
MGLSPEYKRRNAEDTPKQLEDVEPIDPEEALKALKEKYSESAIVDSAEKLLDSRPWEQAPTTPGRFERPWDKTSEETTEH